MKEIKNIKGVFALFIQRGLTEYAKKLGKEAESININSINIERPKDEKLGDAAAPMFIFAKSFKTSPAIIAKEVVKILVSRSEDEVSLQGATYTLLEIGSIKEAGGYINLTYNKENFTYSVLKSISDNGDNYGKVAEDGRRPLQDKKVMIEFSSPNTNKPLHLGHLRNDALGESVARILTALGATVQKVNLVNDRGVHICKSMIAYNLFHKERGETPKTLGIKGDHFVGQCYVEFDKYAKEHPEILTEAEKMLVKWEEGDKEVRALWTKMNSWTMGGLEETYKTCGINFDKIYYESNTYLKGKSLVEEGINKGVFFKDTDGAVKVDVTNIVGCGKNEEEHKKVLLRKDGTSVYITQDLGTAVARYADYPFDKMIYVVASEQNYHFKILFYLLNLLGYSWAKNLFHLSYGLVNLPNGRMKSREGTVVDADDLIEELKNKAIQEIDKRASVSTEKEEEDKEEKEEEGQEIADYDKEEVAKSIALAALNYYLLAPSPQKEIVFNTDASLSFTGNTGPYLQYMCARISSILRKAAEKGLNPSIDNLHLLTAPAEFSLIKTLDSYYSILKKAGDALDPSILTTYLYDLCKAFSKFYSECPVLKALDNKLITARLCLVKCCQVVLKGATPLVLVPFLERM